MGTQIKHPGWWTSEHTSGWEKVKDAFRRDWEQTKADFSKKAGHELNQGVGDTLQQAGGSERIPPGNEPNPTTRNFSEVEPAIEFGHGARLHYGTDWNPELETKLEKDWSATGSGRKWSESKDDVRRGFVGKALL